MRRALVGITVACLAALGFTPVAAPTTLASPHRAAAPGCDPVMAEPEFRGGVPSPDQVLDFKLGKRQATTDEIGRYWRAADRASDRVVTGKYGHSVQGRPLRYALVGDPSTLDRLPAIRRDLALLRDPATSDEQAEAIVGRTPPILWIAANVHGNEPSGADAVVRLLYELSDRSDCVARAITKHAIVGLIPTQNPDGREHDRRYNANAFDMNRDGIANTQPEIAARQKLLWRYPPQLFVDEHENSGRKYFFPPDADPIYHETPDGLYQEIEDLYGPANSAAFDANGWNYETWESGYDFFAQVYGDTVPTTQMGAVGMTFEQGDSTPYPKRVLHQYTSALTTLFTGATHSKRVLHTWRDTFVDAQEQGESCELEPNRVYNPGNDLLRPVPDRAVCGYFLLGDSRATQLTVSRLQDAHVEVHQLAGDTVVSDYRPYGEEPRSKTMPAGTYWISLAQAQKHWVQAALNEDTYVPFPYFYDVSGWSLPLMAGIRGGSTGEPVTAPVVPAPRLGKPRTPRPTGPIPRIVVLDQWRSTFNDYQNTGWLKWRLKNDWRLPYEVLVPTDVTPAALRNVDVLVVGNVDAAPVYKQLGEKGRKAVSDWVDGGGRYVGWQEGALLAGSLGISEVGMDTPEAESPGALMRIRTPDGPTMIEWDSDYNLTLAPTEDSRVAGAFPSDMFVSGFARKAGTLADTVLQTVEDVGDGSVTVFGYEPNFRAVVEGSAAILREAVLRTPTDAIPWDLPRATPRRQSASDVLRLSHSRAWRVAHENGEEPRD